MKLENIIPIGKNEYAVRKIEDLCQLSLIADIGAKALCLDNKKVYIQTKKNEWVSI